MKKRDYPLFLIDRSKLPSYPFDYIACFDIEVGFVARVMRFADDVQYNEYITQSKQVTDSEYTSIVFRLDKGGLILVIEDFLYNVEWTNENKNRIKILLKKALKKYMHAEVKKTI